MREITWWGVPRFSFFFFFIYIRLGAEKVGNLETTDTDKKPNKA